jgi:hypothetical protein
MKTYSFIVLAILPAAAMAVSMDSYFSTSYEGDSLTFSIGRHKLDLDLYISQGPWSLEVEESFISSDSGGIVQRYLNSMLESDLDFRYTTGPALINPDFRYVMHMVDGSEQILPASAGVAVRKGYMRPGIALGVDLPGNLSLNGRFLYWDRDIDAENGDPIAWTESRYGGGLIWETPWGFDASVNGVAHNTTADDIDYESDWSRLDFALSTLPKQLPTRTQVMAEIRYSVLDGDDYLDNPIASRMTGRIRAVQQFSPVFSLNMTVTSTFDFDDGETRTAATQGAARLVYQFRKSGDVPSSLSVGGQYTTSSIETSRLDIGSRINVWRGLSLLLNTDFWEGPTSVPGAGATRKKVVLGAGLEYRIIDNLLVWAKVEQERSDFSEVEVWERLSTGLEFYPGRLFF